MISANSTIAQFNRVYNQGVKNHFTLLGSKDQAKFDKIYGVEGATEEKAGGADEAAAKEGPPARVNNISDDEEEDEVAENINEEKDLDLEDTHEALKIVLQRQFFEAVARAAAVKYASGMNSEALPTLSHKLDYLFEHNLKPLAVKNKSKTAEEVKTFKLADKVFEEYGEHLDRVFKFFSAKAKPPANVLNGRLDVTLKVDELLDMLRKANLLDGKTTDLELEEVIHMIEKYYDPATTLKDKLKQERFDDYAKANPMLLKVNQEAAARKEREEQARRDAEQRRVEGQEDGEQNEEAEAQAENDGEGQEAEEVDEEALRAREEAELAELQASWKKQVLSEHLVYIKGVELVYYEFKELLLEIALRLKDQLDVPTSKPRSLIKKFLDELFLKRLNPYIKFNLSKSPEQAPGIGGTTRAWPESAKDQAIKEIMEARRKKEAAEARLKAEEDARQAELEAQAQAEAAEEAQPAEEELAKAAAEEEAKKKAQEAAGGDQAEEDDVDEDDADLDDVDDDESDY